MGPNLNEMMFRDHKNSYRIRLVSRFVIVETLIREGYLGIFSLYIFYLVKKISKRWQLHKNV